MILSISIGNDFIKLGLGTIKNLSETWSITTRPMYTNDEAEAEIRNFFSTITQRDTNTLQHPLTLRGAIIASVVPSLTNAWVQASQSICKSRPLVVGPGIKTGLRMNYNDPSEIGADRIANIVAARALFETPCIVIDMGTTTNFSIIDKQGAFCGSIIAPGMRLSAQALSKKAAQLFDISINAPASVVGKTTQEALRSGIIFGEVARLDGLIEQIWQHLGYQTDIVSTGIDACELAALSKYQNHVENNLTLNGLMLMYEKNRPTAR